MSETQVIERASCGVTNRVPIEKIKRGLTPICGRCKTRIPIDVNPVTVTDIVGVQPKSEIARRLQRLTA